MEAVAEEAAGEANMRSDFLGGRAEARDVCGKAAPVAFALLFKGDVRKFATRSIMEDDSCD